MIIFVLYSSGLRPLKQNEMKFKIILAIAMLIAGCGSTTDTNYLIPYTESGNEPINLAVKYENGVLTVKGIEFIVPVGCHPYLSAYKNNGNLAMNVYGVDVSKNEGIVVFCAIPGTYAKKIKRLSK